MYLSRDNIYAAKSPSAFAIPGFFASRDAPVFPLYIAVNAAFTGIYAVFSRICPMPFKHFYIFLE
jgi:hypothetical protein